MSSKRRHTSYIGDWSADVCSSDLAAPGLDVDEPRRRAGDRLEILGLPVRVGERAEQRDRVRVTRLGQERARVRQLDDLPSSAERRVGEGGGARRLRGSERDSWAE